MSWGCWFESLLQANLKHLSLKTVLFTGCHLCQAISMLSQFARWMAQNPRMILCTKGGEFIICDWACSSEQWALMLCPVRAFHSDRTQSIRRSNQLFVCWAEPQRANHKAVPCTLDGGVQGSFLCQLNCFSSLLKMFRPLSWRLLQFSLWWKL